MTENAQPFRKLPSPPRRAANLIEWTGRVPEGLAAFLGRLSPWDLPEVYGLVGRFKEVRELANIARRLHQVLEQGPRTAASGRWSFEEFMTTKAEIVEIVRSLHRRVDAAADEAELRFPENPRRKENFDGPVPETRAA